MNHWNFIFGAYGVTLLVMLVEILALRSRRRTALDAAHAVGESAAPAARLTRA